MRVKAELWVKAYIRQCFGVGVPAAVVRKGDGDAGAIFIKVNLLDGRAQIYGPAPAGFLMGALERMWSLALGGEPSPEERVDDYLLKQSHMDPDIWVIEIEDRNGRHFLGEDVLEL